MALIKCKECDAEVSDKAKACPKCGAPLVKAVSGRKWLIAIPLSLVVFSCAFQFGKGMDAAGSLVAAEADSFGKGQKSPVVTGYDNAGAKLACRDFVRARASRPFDAEFPAFERFDAATSPDDPSLLMISSYVRSREGTRSFNCTTKKQADGKWYLLELKFFG